MHISSVCYEFENKNNNSVCLLPCLFRFVTDDGAVLIVLPHQQTLYNLFWWAPSADMQVVLLINTIGHTKFPNTESFESI